MHAITVIANLGVCNGIGVVAVSDDLLLLTMDDDGY